MSSTELCRNAGRLKHNHFWPLHRPIISVCISAALGYCSETNLNHVMNMRPILLFSIAIAIPLCGSPARAASADGKLRLIREWNADIVMGPRPNDYHPDHRYTGVLVQDAAYMV
jgi:hypothetical protein